MDKFYQVFISSTFADLQDERKAVSDALAKAGFFAAGMELFPASNLQQLDFIKKVIDRSDYYVVIVAGRYGSLAEGGKSFTELEYEYALSKRIPVLAMLHRAPRTIAGDKTDLADADQWKKLEAFRARLSASKVVALWASIHELTTAVSAAVFQSTNLEPGVGWVRGDQAIDPKVLQEAERLRIENADLKAKLAKAEGSTFPTDVAGPNTQFEFVLTGHYYGTSQSIIPFVVEIAVGEAFELIYDAVIAGKDQEEITLTLARRLSGRSPEAPQKKVVWSIQPDSVWRLRNQLEALGLIRLMPTGRDDPSWQVTEDARKYIGQVRAVKPSPGINS